MSLFSLMKEGGIPPSRYLCLWEQMVGTTFLPITPNDLMFYHFDLEILNRGYEEEKRLQDEASAETGEERDTTGTSPKRGIDLRAHPRTESLPPGRKRPRSNTFYDDGSLGRGGLSVSKPGLPTK